MGPKELPGQNERKLFVKASVAVVPLASPSPLAGRAVYFARRRDGLWTAISGHLEPREDLGEAAVREFEEESPFRKDHLELQRPDVLTIVGETRTSIGFVFIAIVKDELIINQIGADGLEIDGPEIDLIKPFNRETIQEIHDSRLLYKPEFNMRVVEKAARCLIPLW